MNRATFYGMLVFLAITLLILLQTKKTNDSWFYVKKNDIQEKLINAIKKDASSDDIKMIYLNQNHKYSYFKRFYMRATSQNIYYYNDQNTLEKVLNDILNKHLTSEKELDNKTIIKLKNIIKINNEKNPFDKLKPNQKDYFLYLREKLTIDKKYENYKEIIEKIVNEIKYKNNETDKLLDKSNLSFWISIFAVLISIIIGIYQIYLHKKENKWN